MPFMPKALNSENLTKYLSYTIIISLIWASIWSIVGEEALPPNGTLFNLIVIYIVSIIFGKITQLLHMPPLLGMLISGFMIGNTFDINLNKKLSTILRTIALVIILLRAGLGLDPKAIRKLSGVCLRLSFSPCLIEAITIAFASYVLLKFPIKWGFLLGFVLAAVSPAVVVPGLIRLQEQQMGTDKGIPTLVIAAASVDDVLAITGFGVCLGLVFDSGNSLIWSIFKGPVEAFIGVLYGIIIGIILWFIPIKWNSYKNQTVNGLKQQRLVILLLSGIFGVFGSTALDLGGAGALACLVLSFIAALKWRTSQLDEPIQKDLKALWLLFQPFLFALIGAEVRISDMSGNAIGFATLTLIIGLIMRSITAILVVFGANLNWKEKLFISLAWLPKATVQAAVGPIALDFARQRQDLMEKDLATSVLTIAVLAILITAPLGAIAISIMGPKCLTKSALNKNVLETKLEIEDLKDEEHTQQTLFKNH